MLGTKSRLTGIPNRLAWPRQGCERIWSKQTLPVMLLCMILISGGREETSKCWKMFSLNTVFTNIFKRVMEKYLIVKMLCKKLNKNNFLIAFSEGWHNVFILKEHFSHSNKVVRRDLSLWGKKITFQNRFLGWAGIRNYFLCALSGVSDEASTVNKIEHLWLRHIFVYVVVI